MNSQQEITCPKCGHMFPLTQAFTKDIEEQLKGEFDVRYKEIISELKKESDKEKLKLKKEMEEKNSIEFLDMKAQLEDAKKKNTDFVKKELELRKKQRELEEAKINYELELQRKLDEETKKIEITAKTRIDNDYRLKMKDKENELSNLRNQIEELRRKSELGSQQAQGETLELELEDFLKVKFHGDEILPVAKGKRGADIIQIVKDRMGKVCGKIIWESKRTKAWGGDWVAKLKQDQLSEKAEIAVIVSQVLPEQISHFGNIENVWVCSLPATEGVAMMLREQLQQIEKVRLQRTGASQSMEAVYGYLCSNEFKLHMENIVGSFVDMKIDLDKERNVFEKQWAKREKQLKKVFSSTSQMYGDFQGYIGSALPEIKHLELGE